MLFTLHAWPEDEQGCLDGRMGPGVNTQTRQQPRVAPAGQGRSPDQPSDKSCYNIASPCPHHATGCLHGATGCAGACPVMAYSYYGSGLAANVHDRLLPPQRDQRRSRPGHTQVLGVSLAMSHPLNLLCLDGLMDMARQHVTLHYGSSPVPP